MDIQIGGEPDRLIGELYVWVVRDSRTQLEGIFSMALPGGQMEMQCATSSKVLALKIGEAIKRLPFQGKQFRLLRYEPVGIIAEI